MNLNAGDKVVFIKAYIYDDVCNCCGNDIHSFIEEDDTRTIEDVGEELITFYECFMRKDEAHLYIKLIEDTNG